MLRGDPFIRLLAGFSGEVAATAEWLVTVTQLPTPTGTQCPRCLEVFDWQGRSQGSCELGVGGGPVRIDTRGTIWLATAGALLGFDERARQKHFVEPPLAEGATIDAFLPLADGFVVACGGRTSATVMRLRADGSPVWTTAMASGPIEYTLGEETIGPWTPKDWCPASAAPLVVAGGSLLAGFGESWAQVAHRRSALNLADGTVRWTTPAGPYTGVTAFVPDGFLLGKRLRKHAATLAIRAGAAVMSWPIEGHSLVTDGRLWVVADGNPRLLGGPSAVAVVPRDGRPAAFRLLSLPVRGTPCALAGETIVLLCGQAWTRIDASGEIVEQRELGALAPHVGRVVTDNRGRFAFLMHAYRDFDPSQMWILDTDLPRLALGPWPCDGGDPEHSARCDDPGWSIDENMSTLTIPADAARLLHPACHARRPPRRRAR